MTFVALNSILCKDKYDLEESAEAADAWNGADRYVARLDSRRRCALFFSDHPNLQTQRSIQWSTSLGIQPFDILKRPVHA